MKTNFTLTFILIALLLVSAVAMAQITITSSDISALNAVGSVTRFNVDTTTAAVNIGSPGETSWDFSNLKSHVSASFTSVTPAGTPYFSDFPGSNVVFTFVESIEGINADGWLYQTQNTESELTNGVVLKMTSDGDVILFKTVNSPAQLDMELPFTYNSQWGSNYTSANTVYYNGFPFSNSSDSYSESVIVDAYGTMIMPGGIVLNALRVKRDERSFSGGISDRMISYSFVAKDGSRIEVTAKDTTHTSSGIIQVEDVSWFVQGPAVGIESLNQITESFSLSQNFPNPFSTTTRINYTIIEYSSVTLKLYDFLGREVATLVNEEKSPGNYEVVFEGSYLPDGIYFYRLQAGSSSETRKMTISK